MRVKQLKVFLNKIVQILEVYESYSLDEMLDDIISKVKSDEEIKTLKKKKEKLNVDFNVIQNNILQISNPENIIGELTKLDKNTLIDFGKFAGVKVDKRDSKSSIARVITGHMNFPRLNEKMSQREKVTDIDSN